MFDFWNKLSGMMKPNYKKVTHCIFDLDGTLIDSEVIYTQAVERLLAPYGKKFTLETKLKIMGLKSDALGNYMVQNFNLPMTSSEYVELQDSLALPMMDTVRLMPSVERLLRHLSFHDVPMALATSSSMESFKIKTKNNIGLFKLFHHKVFGSTDPEVKNGKPAPDIFLIAASRFPDKPKPECCLVFEDAPNGVRAAISAGMQVVMTPMPELPCEYSEGATQRLDSLDYFVPEDFGLPPYEF